MYYRNVDKPEACPRVLHKRSQSARETYHPAITDLSEQALRLPNGFSSDEETCIYPLPNGHFNDRSSRHDLTNDDFPSRADDAQNGKFSEISIVNQVNDTAVSRPPSIRINSTRLPKVQDESYRDRVCMSAHNRLKIGAFYRRPKSVDISKMSATRSPRGLPSNGYSEVDMENNNNYIAPNFMVRNSCSTAPEVAHSSSKKNVDESQHRSPNKGRQPGTLLSSGCEEKVNGFHQHLVNKHPLLKQKISRWLTNGFKIQSLRSRSVRSLPGDRRPSSERHSWSRGSRRKISEHNLVEDMKKIKLRQYNLTNEDESCKHNECALTSSLTITNLSRDATLTNFQRDATRSNNTHDLANYSRSGEQSFTN